MTIDSRGKTIFFESEMPAETPVEKVYSIVVSYSHVQHKKDDVSKRINEQIYEKEQKLQVNYEAKSWNFHPLSTMFVWQHWMNPLTEAVGELVTKGGKRLEEIMRLCVWVQNPVSAITYFSSTLFFCFLSFFHDINFPARLQLSCTALTFRRDFSFLTYTTLIFRHDLLCHDL